MMEGGKEVGWGRGGGVVSEKCGLRTYYFEKLPGIFRFFISSLEIL